MWCYRGGAGFLPPTEERKGSLAYLVLKKFFPPPATFKRSNPKKEKDFLHIWSWSYRFFLTTSYFLGSNFWSCKCLVATKGSNPSSVLLIIPWVRFTLVSFMPASSWKKMTGEEVRLANAWCTEDGLPPSAIAERLGRDKSVLTWLLVKADRPTSFSEAQVTHLKRLLDKMVRKASSMQMAARRPHSMRLMEHIPRPRPRPSPRLCETEKNIAHQPRARNELILAAAGHGKMMMWHECARWNGAAAKSMCTGPLAKTLKKHTRLSQSSFSWRTMTPVASSHLRVWRKDCGQDPCFRDSTSQPWRKCPGVRDLEGNQQTHGAAGGEVASWEKGGPGTVLDPHPTHSLEAPKGFHHQENWGHAQAVQTIAGSNRWLYGGRRAVAFHPPLYAPR